LKQKIAVSETTPMAEGQLKCKQISVTMHS